jgi:ABC-type transport system substrate-binding protein
MRQKITRRGALLLGGAALAAPSLSHAQRADPRVLRFVPQAALSIIDPVASLAGVAVNHSYYVYDTLYGMDARMRVQPQMAEGHSTSDDGLTWTIRLREGLFFHDGEPVRSRDCAASLRRWCSRDTFGRTLGSAVVEWQTPDDRTLVIRLSRRFPLLLDALAKPGTCPAFIMPERIGNTEATKPFAEVIGSGPYRFATDEFVPGSRAAYRKFDRYVPRQEAPEWTSGGKVVHFERVEWMMMPDQATAAAALQAGEVDWWEHRCRQWRPGWLHGRAALQSPASALQQREGTPGRARRRQPARFHGRGDEQRRYGLQCLPFLLSLHDALWPRLGTGPHGRGQSGSRSFPAEGKWLCGGEGDPPQPLGFRLYRALRADRA